MITQQTRSNDQVLSRKGESDGVSNRTILCGFGIADGLREMTMEQYLAHVTSGFYTTQVAAMRRETNDERRGQLKKKLYYILPQGRIREGRRPYAIGAQPTKDNIEYAPVQMLDLDVLPEGCSTPADAWYRMRLTLQQLGLAHYPMVVMESVSGKGLHLYVRLTEEMARMDRREVILQWSRMLGVDFDLAVTDPARRAFQSPYMYTPQEDVALLFGAPLTEEQREAMKHSVLTTDYTCFTDYKTGGCSAQQGNNPSNPWLPGAFPNSEAQNCQLEDLAANLVEQICGTATPPEGMRNNTLFEAARTMCYLDGVTEADIAAAFAPIDWLGLPESEARACIHSAARQDKTWKYVMPPLLVKAIGQLTMGNSQLTMAPAANINNMQPVGEISDMSAASLSLPDLATLPPLIAHVVDRIPENARASAAQALFAPLGSYLNNACVMRDLSNNLRHMQFTEIVGGETSSGKGYLPRMCEAIMARRIAHDREAYLALDNWRAECQQLPKGEQRPPKPCVPTYYLKTNITQAALIEKMKLLETVGGRALMVAPEIAELKYCQSATGGSAAHQLLLAAHDTPSQWGADRAGIDSISASTTLSLNIAASATPYGLATFLKHGAENGTLNRCSASIVSATRDLPRYEDFDEQWQATLSPWLDNIEQATGEIHCDEADLVIEDLRQWYNRTPEIADRPVLYAICHRQILIAKQRAYLLYIAHGYQWTDAMENFTRWSFHYQLHCLYTLFMADILTYENTQRTPLAAGFAPVGGKRSELLDLPRQFTVDDLIALRKSRGATHNLESLGKEQLRTWRRRGFIALDEKQSACVKTPLWYVKHPDDTSAA